VRRFSLVDVLVEVVITDTVLFANSNDIIRSLFDEYRPNLHIPHDKANHSVSFERTLFTRLFPLKTRTDVDT